MLKLTGPKTVVFWAPAMKWALVAAGLNDLRRPAEKLSVSQNLGNPITLRTLHATYERTIYLPHRGYYFLCVALAATGFIWVRWSFVIVPVNVSLAAVRLVVPS